MNITAIPPLSYLDRFIDQTGMYRVVTLALAALFLCSLVAAAVGALPYSIESQLLAVIPGLGLALLLNIGLARLLSIHANHESAVITALILFFLFIPQSSLLDNWPLFLAITLGVLSKYVIVWRKQHLTNAAAMGAVLVVVGVWLLNLTTGSSFNTDIFSWWVSNPTLFWPLLILGTIVVTKVRKWTPVIAFLTVSIVVFLFEECRFFGPEVNWLSSVELFLLSWPALFLAFFMLTEPFTMPPTKATQVIYGGLVGFLMHTTIFAGWFPMTPELALVMGNLALQPFRLHQKLFLVYQERIALAANTFELVFKKPTGMNFTAGQYLEWMLPHTPTDSRGIRRYFTIASAPEEPDVRVALRFVENGSAYKKALGDLTPGDTIVASQRAGDFSLRRDPHTKYGFVAGGIGITPFRSFVGHLQALNQPTDAVLFYGNNVATDIAYRDYFDAAADTIGLRTVHILSQETGAEFETGYFRADLVKRYTPDYRERVWYISGPPVMVRAGQQALRSLGVPRTQIVTDFFPGLA